MTHKRHAGFRIVAPQNGANNDAEIDAVMGRLQSTADVLVSGTDALFFVGRAHMAALALDQASPTIFDDREYATAGALASYGADFLNVMESAGEYTGRITVLLRLLTSACGTKRTSNYRPTISAFGGKADID